jgi:TonB-linked SusC/RagA family outer membrane protein
VFALLASGCLFAAVGQAQQTGTGIVAGRVTDARSGELLSDATVTIEGTQLVASTGADGTFRLARVPAGPHVLVARRIGYNAVRHSASTRDGTTVTVDFALQASALNLEAIVVTGTAGNQTRVAQGAVVSTINASDVIANAPIANVSQLLEARVPGVLVTQGSGTTGASSRINIRGAASISLSNEPLVFIDGVRMRSSQRTLAGTQSPGGVGGQTISALNDVNPDDIESIEVVKGPAAATLYGADASAGVIQIITKKGKLGTKRFAQSLTTEYNAIQPNFTPYSSYGICSAAKVAPTSTSALCKGQAVGTIVSDNPNERGGAFRNGNLQSLRYSGQGGGDNFGFYVSGAADNEQGTTPNNVLVRRSGRADVNWFASPTLRFDANLALSRNDYQLPNGDQSSYGYLIMAALSSPTSLTADASGQLAPGYAANLSVPAISSILDQENTLRSTPSLQVNWNPLTWFTNRLTAGADLSNSAGTTFFPKNTQNWYSGAQANGYVLAVRENVNIYTLDYLGNVHTSFLGRSNVTSDLSFGSQFINTGVDLLQGTGQGLITNSANLVSSSPVTTGGQAYNQQKSLGYFAQEQIGFDDKLFLQLGARVDRNSAFGTEASSFFLPKASVSYVLSKESFWQARFAALIPTLRLRAAYGTTGRSPTPGASLQTYTQFSYITDAGTIVPGVAPANPGNFNLKPERGKEFEGGFDAGFLNDRVGVVLTYYNKTTADLLLQQPLAPSLGYTQNPFVNIGKVQNRGWEFELRGTPVDRKSLRWDVNFNGSTLDNKLLSLGNLAPITTSSINVDRKFVVGRPLSAWYVKRIHGVDQATGTATVSDTTEYAGSALPTFQGSFSSTVTALGNLRFYALFQTQRGAKIWNLGQEYRDQFLGNSAEVVLPETQGGYSAQERLLRIGPFKTDAGRTIGGAADPGQVAERYLQSSDFVRLQELSATLILPSRFASAMHATGATLTLGGRNLHLWKSGYQGWDPAVTTSVGSPDQFYSQFTSMELFTLPPTRRWLARLNFEF